MINATQVLHSMIHSATRDSIQLEIEVGVIVIFIMKAPSTISFARKFERIWAHEPPERL